MATMGHAPSYYAASANPQPLRPVLQGAITADICIVGAGYTGLSAGLHLAEAGFKVVILEAEKIAWGASGRNGGQLVHSYSRDMDVIEARHGKATAQALGGMAFEGAKIIRERIEKYHIQCDLKNGGIYAAKTKKKIHDLEEHKKLWEAYGNHELSMHDKSEALQLVNANCYEAILVDKSGGHFHSMNLALGEATALESHGGVIYENTRVTKIDRGEKAVVHTAQGKVTASFVILACNAYIGNLEPALSQKTMPCGTQVVATEPLGEKWKDIIPSDYCVEDNNFLLDYYRLTGDKRLLFGGGVIYGARDPKHVESIIRPNLEKTFPQLRGVKIEYGWTGNFSLTLSRLPQVGRLSDNIYYSQGCSGHGITFTHLIGRVLSEAIRGQAERFSVFEQLPHYPFPGGRAFRIPFTALGAWWYNMRDRLGV
jgi:gamma-glutamylputrescine oxidase